MDQMESFAKEGFRTLVLAYRIISEEDYKVKLLTKLKNCVDLFKI